MIPGQRPRVIPPSSQRPPHQMGGTPQPGDMSPHFATALVEMRDDLMVNVNVKMHLSARMHAAAGGFMSDLEAALVTGERTQHKQMTKFLEILSTKGDKEYHSFLRILRDSSMGHWADAVEAKAASYARMQATPDAPPSASAGGPGKAVEDEDEDEALEQAQIQLGRTQNQLAEMRQQVRQLQAEQERERQEQQERIGVLQKRVAQAEQELVRKDQKIAQLEQQLAAARGAQPAPVRDSPSVSADADAPRFWVEDADSLAIARVLVDDIVQNPRVSVAAKLKRTLCVCMDQISKDEQLQKQAQQFLVHLKNTETIPEVSYYRLKETAPKRELIVSTMNELVSRIVADDGKRLQKHNTDVFMNLLKALHQEGCHSATQVLLAELQVAQ